MAPPQSSPAAEGASAPAGSPQAASGSKAEGAERRTSGGASAPAGDFLGKLPGKPTGSQAKPATFAKDGGTIPSGLVPSSGGPVPAGVFDAAERERRLDLRRTSGRLPDDEELDEQALGKLSAPEVRAIGASRGYQMPAAGGRAATRRAFLEKQEKDPAFSGEEK